MNHRTMERIDAALEGRLDPVEFEALQEELRNDPAALDHWCRQAAIHGGLEWELSAQASAPPLATARLRKSYPKWLAAAALVLGGLGVGLLIPRSPEKDRGHLPQASSYIGETVGRITAVRDAVWRGPSPAPGEWVHTGALELTAGSAEIAFDCGATVRLRGPARLHLSSPTRALLESGKATVDIPRQAYGFVFETPTTEISRRMSRFAVAVEDDGHSEVHVLNGQIQLSGKLGDLETLDLDKDKAVRVNEDGSLAPATRYEVDQLTTSLPESADLLPEWYLHWSFDGTEATSGIFRESGIHPSIGKPIDAQVHLPHPDAEVSLVPGRFGNAVKMNGQRGFLSTEYPGFSGNSPRTVTFWTRIDPDTPETLAYSFLSWGIKDKPGGGKWQLGWNTGNDNSGTVGAIRTEVELGYQIGSTDLRTGRWHHIACVFSGGPDADISTHVRHYVDGRLDPTTAVLPRKVDTRITGKNSLPFTLGRRLDQGDHYRTFSGELDEVYLFPAALTPEQIEQLYRENKPPALRR